MAELGISVNTLGRRSSVMDVKLPIIGQNSETIFCEIMVIRKVYQSRKLIREFLRGKGRF